MSGAAEIAMPMTPEAGDFARPAEQEALLRATHNPFATRWTRPGTLDFELPPQVMLDDLIGKFARHGWRGAITGPHGSGKSTLLAALARRLEAADHRLARLALRESDRCLPPEAKREIETLQALWANEESSTKQMSRRAIVVVDGYERLGRWARWRLDRACRRSGLGLLLTAHGPTSAPTLFATSPTVELAVGLAARLMGAEWSEPFRARAEASFARHNGNLREVLFDLYDLYESCREARLTAADMK